MEHFARPVRGRVGRYFCHRAQAYGLGTGHQPSRHHGSASLLSATDFEAGGVCARVAFEYPAEDNAQKWQKQMRDQQVAAKQTKREAEALPALLAVEKLNFGYRVNGGNEHLRPLRVYDDAAKVYIQMPSAVEHREAPVLLVVGNDGKGEMTNYRVRGQTYIVDRLFDRAHLVLGSGKKAQKVEIIREPKG